jgi:hypothetical protein
MIARRPSPCYFTRHVMQRALISAAVFIIFGSSFAASRAASAGSDSPASVSEKDDTSLVKAAFDATNWDDAATMPFQLSAQVKLFDEHGKATDGQLTLLFAAQDRWREEINWFGGTTLQLVVGDRIWRKGPDQATHPLLRLNTTLELYRWLGFIVDLGPISTSRLKDVQGTSARCVDITFAATAHREICLDVKTGLPLRIKDETRELTILQGDYLPLGLKRFPHHIRYSVRGETLLELNIDSVTVLENPPPDAFRPPEQTGSMPWCLDEKGPQFVLGRSPFPSWMPASSNRSYEVLTVGGRPTSEFSMVVFDVGSDGKVKGVKLYDRHGVVVQNDYAAGKLGGVIFHPAMCGGKAVEAEFFFVSPSH